MCFCYINTNLLLIQALREVRIVTIVSPLTALMLDQKQKFSEKGLSVEYIGEAQKDTDSLTAVMQGKVQLVYMSSESLLWNWRIRRVFSSTVYQNNLVGFVVDEAHCVKMWCIGVATYLKVGSQNQVESNVYYDLHA